MKRQMGSNARQWVERLEDRTLLSGWATVSDYPLGGSSGFSRAMAADSAGNVYSVGDISNNSNLVVGFVREKPAGSSSWSTIEQYKYNDGTGANFYGAAADAKGDLFVSGMGGASNHWIVLEKPAGQSTFKLIDDIGSKTQASSTSGNAQAICVDGSGNVFAAGALIVSTTNNRMTTTTVDWVVRELAAGKSAFVTIDSVASTSAAAASITSINSGPNAGLYAAGHLTTGSSNYWAVRKSSDGGATWNTVDLTSFQSTRAAGAHSITADSAGNLFVAGIGTPSGTTTHWMVRESNDGGGSWTTVDDYQIVAGSTAYAWSTASDSTGNVYVTGWANDPSASSHWIVRTNVGGNWHTIDDYQLAAGKTADASSVVVDHAGNVYAAGEALDAFSGTHLIVRELPALAAAIATPSQNPATGAYSTTIRFNRPVSGFDLSDLTLTTPGGSSIPGSDLASDGATLTTGDNVSFVLTLPAGLTGNGGAYILTLTATGSGITDADLLALTRDASMSWTE